MTARLAVFLVVCAAQLAWAASAIWSGEARLEAGRVWRFRTAPVDPADLVRGRYVRLAFRATRGPALESTPFEPGATAYALLAEDAEGFATVRGVTHQRPEGDAYLAVRVRRQAAATPAPPGAPHGIVHFEFPVDRLYLPERKAPAAEQRYRDAEADTWAEIRVHRGQATLLDLHAN